MDGNGWIVVSDDVELAEGSMLPVYPLGINILLARVDGSVYDHPEGSLATPTRYLPLGV